MAWGMGMNTENWGWGEYRALRAASKEDVASARLANAAAHVCAPIAYSGLDHPPKTDYGGSAAHSRQVVSSTASWAARSTTVHYRIAPRYGAHCLMRGQGRSWNRRVWQVSYTPQYLSKLLRCRAQRAYPVILTTDA